MNPLLANLVEDSQVKGIYARLKNLNKKDWGCLMKRMTRAQKRKLFFYIKKKNKQSLQNIKNIQPDEKEMEKKIMKKKMNFQVLIDYSNVNYGLNLKNCIARIMRVYRIEEDEEFVKGLHLYMNILGYVIFKKFSIVYKEKQTNRHLLMFLKTIFPEETEYFEKEFAARWTTRGWNVDDLRKTGEKDSNENKVENEKEETKNDITDILEKEIKDVKEINDIKVVQENSSTFNRKGMMIGYTDSIGSNDKSTTEILKQKAICDKQNKLIQNICDMEEKSQKDNVTWNHEMKEDDLMKIIKDMYDQNVIEHKEGLFKNIQTHIFDPNRRDYRLQLKSLISQTLTKEQYKKYTELREKVFKDKKKVFMEWLHSFTKLSCMDFYLVNFFIFLFLDRLNLIIETYLRLNYFGTVETCKEFVNHYEKIPNFSSMLKEFTESNEPNKEGKEINELIDLEKNKEKKKRYVMSSFEKRYKQLVTKNKKKFFLAIKLMYNLDVYYLKITNKINFDQLTKINIASYINETNVYDLIQFNKEKDIDPWKKLTQHAILENSNLKIQSFDCFSIYLIFRFKSYLEEFKENANIDYIYRSIKEEYDKIQKHLENENNEEAEFEYKHLVPIYLEVQNQINKAFEYMKFYGNLTSLVNFINKVISSTKKEVKTEPGVSNCEYFDFSFFLNSLSKTKVKEE